MLRWCQYIITLKVVHYMMLTLYLFGENSPYIVSFWEASKSTPTFWNVQIHCQQGTHADVDGEGSHPMPRDRPRQRGNGEKEEESATIFFSLPTTLFFFLSPRIRFWFSFHFRGSISLARKWWKWNGNENFVGSALVAILFFLPRFYFSTVLFSSGFTHSSAVLFFLGSALVASVIRIALLIRWFHVA